MVEESGGSGMAPAEASELVRRMKARASDLWREPPEDVVPEPKKQEAKPAKVVVKKPKIGIDNLWMTADETIEWTDALAHEWPTDGLTPRSLWEFYHKHAEAVLNGDLTAYTEVLRKANPLGELMEYAHGISMRAPDPDRLEAMFTGRDEHMEKNAGNCLRPVAGNAGRRRTAQAEAGEAGQGCGETSGNRNKQSVDDCG